MAEGQDIPAEVFRAGGQETERVLLKARPGLTDLVNIPAAMSIGLMSELHEANLFQCAVCTMDGLDGEGMRHKVLRANGWCGGLCGRKFAEIADGQARSAQPQGIGLEAGVKASAFD